MTMIDRMMRPVKPAPIGAYTPAAEEIAPGLWQLRRRLAMPGGLVLPAAATIVRLPSGKLFVHSPITLDVAAKEALSSLGDVSVLLAPNAFHYLFVADYQRAFPGATTFYAPGVRERVPSLPPGEVVGETAPPVWEGALEPIVYGPIGPFSEVVLFHPASASVVLTDLGFNMRRFTSGFDRIGWRLFGVPPRFGPSRTARLTLLRDRRAAGPFLRKIREKDFRRILVAHGDPVESDAKGEFERAYRRYLEGA